MNNRIGGRTDSCEISPNTTQRTALTHRTSYQCTQ